MGKKKIKTKRKQETEDDVMKSITNISNEVLAAAYSAASQSILPVLLKVCRLCESKEGPFLNIFEADKLTAKKIDELMPFSVLENDDLPHKICFRCSAKLEELYEFVQKCIKAQENLQNALGKSNALITKSKTAKKAWEEKLNKNNMSNDDICDALIKKAMEGIQGIATQAVSAEETNAIPPAEDTSLERRRITRSRESQTFNKELKTQPQSDDLDEISLKEVKISLEKDDIKPVKNKAPKFNKTETESKTRKSEITEPKGTDAAPSHLLALLQSNVNNSIDKKCVQRKTNNSMSSLSFEIPSPNPVKEYQEIQEKTVGETKPFNIMDYVFMIKVNGVGMLFQCRLCNRNFLKKEVVESHNCAKNGVPKIDVLIAEPAPEPPKASTVKYIKIDDDMKKTLTEKIKKAEKILSESSITPETVLVDNVLDNSRENAKEPPVLKLKPRAGPASKTRRRDSSSKERTIGPPTKYSSDELVTIPSAAAPIANSRLKICPGPNNVFTLVQNSSDATSVPALSTKVDETKKPNRKRKSNNESVIDQTVKKVVNQDETDIPEIIDLDAPENSSKPYPVGLFQTLASECLYEPSVSKAPPTFTTPAMKKQSYTVVQTGHPNKLLISAKPTPAEPEVSKKRQRKTKSEVKDKSERKEPFSVTLEDRTLPPGKDSSFFTFINVDPLLQPSYVLPTDNIQESQISTSSSVVSQSTQNKGKDNYFCNICNNVFSREKKLLAHIQSHFTKMDEDDIARAAKTSKKKDKK